MDRRRWLHVACTASVPYLRPQAFGPIRVMVPLVWGTFPSPRARQGGTDHHLRTVSMIVKPFSLDSKAESTQVKYSRQPTAEMELYIPLIVASELLELNDRLVSVPSMRYK